MSTATDQETRASAPSAEEPQRFSIPGTATTKLDAAHWRARLAELIDTYRVPGASLGILRDGAITDVSAGVLSKATGVPATPDSVWQIGSISKVWTATLIMQLVDQGKIGLDQPVVEILPDFKVADPEVTAEVTVRHLLTHTSGIDGDVFTDTGRGDDCVGEYVAQLTGVEQNHPLGATWSYCNSGYILLGGIIEKVTGKIWDAALTEQLITPLGLQATVTLPEQALLHRAAVGHVGEPGADPRPTPQMLLPRSAGPAGLITARTHDLLCFARMHLAGGVTADGRRLLSVDSARQMTEHQADVPDPYTLGGGSWGLGWIRFDWNGTELIGHDGSTIGQNAFLRILPGQDFAVALFTNGGDSKGLFQQLYAEIFAELADTAIPPKFEPPAEPPTVDITPWLGRYERASLHTEIFLEDGKPVLKETAVGPLAELDPDAGSHELPLVAVSDNLFAAHVAEIDSWMPVTFYQLDNGARYVHYGVRANPKVDN
ncbi:serine hydrolase domain-containing protein [Nakamurella lactea]|uniref:serine hydrolase domain-containing protein n=1 Tax=Nakamurella lactea TaxID=459515 RepID=UPI0004253E59|nr:serine hydrolase domain-containing protein [Nakamurella lactea]